MPRLVSINPKTLFDSAIYAYSQIRVDTQTHVAHFAGQLSMDRDGRVVGETLEEQFVGARENVVLALQAVDATIADIISLNIYVVKDKWDVNGKQYQETGLALGKPIATLVTVPLLALPGTLVELEITAAVSKEFVEKILRERA